MLSVAPDFEDSRECQNLPQDRFFSSLAFVNVRSFKYAKDLPLLCVFGIKKG